MSLPGSTPSPGWYYAAGDPPGTNRYWDGTQWQGGPQWIAAAGSTPLKPVSSGTPAGAGRRFLATIIDWLVQGIPVMLLILFASTSSSDLSDAAAGSLYALLVALWLGNVIVLQGATGASIGKHVMGLEIIKVSEEQRAGMGWCALRVVVIVVAWWFCCGVLALIDYASLLFDDRRQRISDKALGVEVQRKGTAQPRSNVSYGSIVS